MSPSSLYKPHSHSDTGRLADSRFKQFADNEHKTTGFDAAASQTRVLWNTYPMRYTEYTHSFRLIVTHRYSHSDSSHLRDTPSYRNVLIGSAAIRNPWNSTRQKTRRTF